MAEDVVSAPRIAERGGKDVTISGKPYRIVPHEQLRVDFSWPGLAGKPGVPAYLYPFLYSTSFLDGVLVQKPRPSWARRSRDDSAIRRGFYRALDRAVAILKRLSRRAAFGPPRPPRYRAL